jgi:AraC-like DNA-binding protein/mannose-6-phosphate isomerase-like protein (cupin superfamily)
MSIYRLDFLPEEMVLRFGDIDYLSVSKYEKDWPSHLHSHDLTEFFFVIRGEGKFTVETETFVVQKNDLLIVAPNTKHREESSTINPLEYMVIGVKNLSFKIKQKETQQNYIKLDFSHQQILINGYYETIRDELKKIDSYTPIFLASFVDILIIFLMRKFSIEFYTNQHVKSNPIVSNTKLYIDNNFKTDINLDLLASEMNTSKFHLIRSFSKVYSQSPMQYVTEKRITEAKGLLTTTDMPISLISETVGFTSASYFTQVFKKHTGVNPAQWRTGD